MPNKDSPSLLLCLDPQCCCSHVLKGKGEATFTFLLPNLSWLCSSEKLPTPLRSWLMGCGHSRMLRFWVPGLNPGREGTPLSSITVEGQSLLPLIPTCRCWSSPCAHHRRPVKLLLSFCCQEDRHMRPMKPKNVACCTVWFPTAAAASLAHSWQAEAPGCSSTGEERDSSDPMR